MTQDADIAACAEIVRKGDPDRFLATMAARPEARDILFPLYAFNVEVARAPWVTQEAMIGEMRLQWWRDALEEIREGRSIRRHEVVSALADWLDPEGAECLDRLVAARRWDLYRDPFEDAADFRRHIEETSGGLMWVAARALGDAEESVVRDFAYGVGVANWLRAIPDLEARGCYPLVDGRPEAVVALAEKALGKIQAARAHRSAVSRAAGVALLTGWQAESVLRRAIAAPGRVGAGDLAGSDFAKKAGLMRRAMTGRW